MDRHQVKTAKIVLPLLFVSLVGWDFKQALKIKLNHTIMQATIQLKTITRNRDVYPADVFIEQQDSEPAHPRLGFARAFLQHILSDHYPALHVGDQFKENTLLFTFSIQHIHITAHNPYDGEKRIIVTGVLQD